MAWISFWIVFAALTITSAYIYPYPQYHGGRAYGPPQYRRVEDKSLEQDASILSEHQGRSEDNQLTHQERRVESNLWSPERPIGRSIIVNNYEQNVQDEIKVGPIHSNRDIDAVDYDNEMFLLDPKPRRRSMFIPQVTKDCEKAGLCENSPDYPHEYVESLLAKLPNGIKFNLDVETPKVSDRIRPGDNQTLLLCKPDTRIIYPDKVRTKTGEWVFVVNGKKKKVQGFSGTTCLEEGERCDNIVYYPDGYMPTCVQKRMDRSMWALDHSGALTLVTAGVASCCSCELKSASTVSHQ